MKQSVLIRFDAAFENPKKGEEEPQMLLTIL